MYYAAVYLIQDAVSLNIGKDKQSVIESTKLELPGSSRYYYEGWFFITSNQKVYDHNILFNRGTDFVVTLKESMLHLYVNGGKTNNETGVFDPNGASLLMSVPNFPFQKWAQLVINVDGMSVDLYIDGKFVQNKMHSTIINSTASTSITYGSQFITGKVARFNRLASNINPQTVWNHFMAGSGQSQSLTDYRLNAIVTNKGKQTIDARLV
jgi:hypothetical protein